MTVLERERVLRRAAEKDRCVLLTYRGEPPRMVLPVEIYTAGNGRRLVRAHQLGGTSLSGNPQPYRQFVIDAIDELAETDVRLFRSADGAWVAAPERSN